MQYMTNLARTDDPTEPQLERTVSLPMLVFYGLGVTVGAGIFALIGSILETSEGLAPLAFVAASGIAATTAWTYSYFVRMFPRAGGEALYVSAGLGRPAGTLVGFLVIVAGVISSSVVALAFGGYLSEVTGIAPRVGGTIIVALVVVLAIRGIRESVAAAATVTLIEVGALVVIVALGIPKLFGGELNTALTAAPEAGRFGAITSGAILAFFAFIGFEDIANLAEETRDPKKNAPRAIAWTLGLSLLLYVLVSAITVVLPNREGIATSDAPMARVFEEVSGLDGRGIAIIATLAMTNGILIQIIVAARVAFGLATEGLLPASLQPLATVHQRWHTPVNATLAVTAAILILIMTAPLETLARWTSVVILTIFTLVNVSLIRLARTRPEPKPPRSVIIAAWTGATTSAALAGWELVSLIG